MSSVTHPITTSAEPGSTAPQPSRRLEFAFWYLDHIFLIYSISGSLMALLVVCFQPPVETTHLVLIGGLIAILHAFTLLFAMLSASGCLPFQETCDALWCILFHLTPLALLAIVPFPATNGTTQWDTFVLFTTRVIPALLIGVLIAYVYHLVCQKATRSVSRETRSRTDRPIAVTHSICRSLFRLRLFHMHSHQEQGELEVPDTERGASDSVHTLISYMNNKSVTVPDEETKLLRDFEQR